MADFELDGKTTFIDTRFKTQLDKKILPDLKRKDKDAVFIVDGAERSGKSVFSMQLAGYAASFFKTKFDLSNVCMTPEEFRTKIENSKKNQAVIYDEAHRGMSSARTLSEINIILRDLMMEMGQKNLLVIIVLPTIFLLDKYAALFRAKGLFHIYENKRRRGYWVYYNEKNKLKLYIRGKKEFNYNCMKYPPFRGRFFDQYTLNESEYRRKKAESFKKKPKITREDKYKEQRDKLIYGIYKEWLPSNRKVAKLCKLYGIAQLKYRMIGDIIGQMKEKPQEVGKSNG